MLRRVGDEKNIVVGSETMTEMTKISAFSGRNSDGSFEITENEAILGNGSSDVPREIVVLSGIESTLNHLSKWLVVTVFGIIVIWRHDALAMWAAMGAVANAWLSITLKRILNQERPVASLGSGPGMPSSHAQSIFFASVYAILSLVKSLGLNGVTVTIGVLGLAFSSYLVSTMEPPSSFFTTKQPDKTYAFGVNILILFEFEVVLSHNQNQECYVPFLTVNREFLTIHQQLSSGHHLGE
ncbi:hypothetical protein C5167_037595 [Papaver somniferum]|uniref:Phosphatidic acid phosphatase type 2/haloperoxidase domain-containing protein n=1 Tax=Papaver somniferum TaxID=3469 RepID=A0A4Y7IB56_PAPSO|nr:hypothetical protein C5167_037595 [Papaver somniferum]